MNNDRPDDASSTIQAAFHMYPPILVLLYDATCGGMVRNACITWFAICRLLA
jgi:hypothetical protein